MRRSRKRENRPAAQRDGSGSHDSLASHDKAALRRDVPQGACNCKLSGEAERALVDRFGHVHDRRVLRDWPDVVKTAMGLKFIDRSELMGAGHG